VLAGRDAVPMDHLRREHDRQDADDDEHERDEEAEVVARDDAEADSVAVPEKPRRNAGAEQADDAEAADGHALAGLAERLGRHAGERGQGDREHRHDGLHGAEDGSHQRVASPGPAGFPSGGSERTRPTWRTRTRPTWRTRR